MTSIPPTGSASSSPADAVTKANPHGGGPQVIATNGEVLSDAQVTTILNALQRRQTAAKAPTVTLIERAESIDPVLRTTRDWPTKWAMLVLEPLRFDAFAVNNAREIPTNAALGTDWLEWLRSPEVTVERLSVSAEMHLDEETAAAPPALAPKSRRTTQLVEALPELVDKLFPTASRESRLATLAGLYQWHDQLEASHAGAQQLEGIGDPPDGDYWHAIMHRREPDYGNAKYWFRHVGKHPVMQLLAGDLGRYAELHSVVHDAEVRPWVPRLTPHGQWDAIAFVDCCQQAARQASPLRQFAELVQQQEMLLLLGHCLRRASGSANTLR